MAFRNSYLGIVCIKLLRIYSIYLDRSDIRLAGKKREIMVSTLKSNGLIYNAEPIMGSLPITHCCSNKGITPEDKAIPSNFYVGKRNLRFYKICNELNVPYGILSDLYGLHMHDVALNGYDTPPYNFSPEQLWELGKLIRIVADERQIKALHYIAAPPTCMVPYLLMLFASGVSFTIHTNNNSIASCGKPSLK